MVDSEVPHVVLGIDPGARWTAGVLRVGDDPVIGFTLGPVDAAGHRSPAAIDDIDDWAAYTRYITRILRAVRWCVETGTARYGPTAVAVENFRVPAYVRYGARGPFRARDWLTPTKTVACVLAAYPDALVIDTDRHGRRPPTGGYPPELTGKRPAHWGPCEARRGERDHECAAYDIAGTALTHLARRQAMP